MPYTWPTELDDARKLLQVVGSLWAETYAGNELVESLLHAKAQQQAQAHLDLLELIACISRLNVPVFHTENWFLLELKESELNAPNLPIFDGTYDFTGQISYDVPATTPLFAWPLPTGLSSAKVILNQITDSTLTYTAGIDFFIEPGVVWLRTNPFSNPDVRISEVFTDNTVTDRIAYLWVYRGQFDWDTVYKQFGYVLGLKLESSRPYKEVINAVYNGLVQGTNAKCVEDFMSAVCDVPLARETETVMYVMTDSQKQWVITDKNAYGFSTKAVVTAAVGDMLSAGDTMTDTLTFYDFNRGVLPDDVRALSAGRGILPTGYFGDLTFENMSSPVLVGENVDGYTKVEFLISGWPGDIEKFWNDVHSKGVAADDTLAMRLDTRTNKTGQPTAVAIPVKINPLGFLIQNVLRGNAFAIRVKPAAFGPEAPGLHAARLLRKLIPPQTLCLLLVELEYDGDVVTMDGPGSETDAGYEEDVDTFQGNSIEESIDPASYVSEDVRIFQIGGYCQ